MGFSESVKREVHHNTRLPQETRETSNQQPNLTLIATKKRTPTTTTTTQLVEGKEITEFRAGINGKKNGDYSKDQ